jgi:arsenate reductase
MKATIYHNPRCSKSRATLALLEERDVDVDVVDYLASPPTRQELEDLLRKLGLPAAAIVRAGEQAFRDSGLSTDAPAGELLDLIAGCPKVLQRPIVVVGSRARIGRPPEQVLEILE